MAPSTSQQEGTKVVVTSTHEGSKDWRIEISVPPATKVKELKSLLSKPPHGLQIGPDQRVLQKARNGKVMTTLKDNERVKDEVVLLNFQATQKVAALPDFKGMDTGIAHAVTSGLADLNNDGDGVLQKVVVTTTTDRYEHWSLTLNVLKSTTALGFKDVLMRAPWNLGIDRTQKVLKRMKGKNAGYLQSMNEDDLVIPEMVLLNYVPPDATPRPEFEKAPSPFYAAKAQLNSKVIEDRRAAEATRKAGEAEFERRRSLHASSTPTERRACSWARTASFAPVLFEITGTGSGNWWDTPQGDSIDSFKPFVIWILGATNEVEGWLVENGYFSDANFTDSRPTQCFVMGHGLRRIVHPAKPTSLISQGQSLFGAHAETISYEEESSIDSLPKPNIVLMLCVEFGTAAPKVPDHVISAAGKVHAAISTRFRIWSGSMNLLNGEMAKRMAFAPLRCPLSALAGDKNAEFDDNGWIIGLQDVSTLLDILKLDLRPSFPESKAPEDKVMAMFWGIIDLKYDNRLPLQDRVKVLETGDGRSSKFSNDGADIPKRFRAKYRMEEGAGSGKHTVVSNNKKLTHDEFVLSGYKHIVPDQLCLPRVYDVGLAQRIIEDLKCKEKDHVVLKLANRSRGAGIIPVPVTELDEVLEELLDVPDASGLEMWYARKLNRLKEETLEVEWGVFEEQYRHWWSNECPFFCVERCCYSLPMPKAEHFGGQPGQLFDGTLRVAFALRRKPIPKAKAQPRIPNHMNYRSDPEPEPEVKEDPLEIEWLGGYWKLPKDDVDSPKLRERVVSAAKSGTAPIPPHQLHEIYAAMGDSVQKLFSASEPTVSSMAQRYGDQPELAGYLTARLAVTLKELARCRQVMNLAQNVLSKAKDGLAKSFTQSYVERGFGVFDAMQPPGLWEEAAVRIRKSIEWHPANATATYLLGMCMLELDQPEEAVDLFHRSLLLDLDFKAPYVNLGVAYLRLRRWEDAIEVSEALLKRHPDSPQCHYHIGVACYFMSLKLEDKASIGYPLSSQEASTYEDLRKRGLQEMLDCRNSDEGARLEHRLPALPPWTEEDDHMMMLLRPNYSVLLKNRRKDIKPVVLSANAGWRFFGWRT